MLSNGSLIGSSHFLNAGRECPASSILHDFSSVLPAYSALLDGTERRDHLMPVAVELQLHLNVHSFVVDCPIVSSQVVDVVRIIPGRDQDYIVQSVDRVRLACENAHVSCRRGDCLGGDQ